MPEGRPATSLRGWQSPSITVPRASGVHSWPELDLYDALVSINVPSGKARAVVDAKEGDMDNMLATKQDLKSLEQKMEISIRRLELENFRLRVDQRFADVERNVTFWFGLMLFTGLGIFIVLVRDWA